MWEWFACGSAVVEKSVTEHDLTTRAALGGAAMGRSVAVGRSQRERPDGNTAVRLMESAVSVCYARVMSDSAPDILVVAEKIDGHELARLTRAFFEDMVKYVVDVERGVAAVGGELHADEKELLLSQGSRQDDLWGANYYPGRGPEDCIEYTSLINIRPAQGNRSMMVEDDATRSRIRELTFALIGQGEPLP